MFLYPFCLATVLDHLNVKKVIWAIPNLPTQIGVGMTAFTTTKEVSRPEEQRIQNLLQTTGKAINVPNEQLINAVTAVSGSGPAYIYYFMDAICHDYFSDTNGRRQYCCRIARQTKLF